MRVCIWEAVALRLDRKSTRSGNEVSKRQTVERELGPVLRHDQGDDGEGGRDKGSCW